MATGFFGGFQTSGAFEVEAFQSTLIIQQLGPSVITFLPAATKNQVPELTDYYCNVAYQDIYGNAIIPVSVQWRVWDASNFVSLQDWTPITPLATNSTVHIPDTYNALGNANNLVETRKVVFWITASGGAQRYDTGIYYVLAVPDVP